MDGAERQRASQFVVPGGKRLAGPRIDQVETDAVETALRRRDRAPRLFLAVRSPQKFKHLCIEALNSYRNAIDPRGGEIGEIGDFRSEERSVGKECVSTCRSRWSQYHSKKKLHSRPTRTSNTHQKTTKEGTPN